MFAEQMKEHWSPVRGGTWGTGSPQQSLNWLWKWPACFFTTSNVLLTYLLLNKSINLQIPLVWPLLIQGDIKITFLFMVLSTQMGGGRCSSSEIVFGTHTKSEQQCEHASNLASLIFGKCWGNRVGDATSTGETRNLIPVDNWSNIRCVLSAHYVLST